MTTPESLYEAASHALNEFRERRMAERRASLRDTPDRRVARDIQQQYSSEPDDSKSPGDPV